MWAAEQNESSKQHNTGLICVPLLYELGLRFAMLRSCQKAVTFVTVSALTCFLAVESTSSRVDDLTRMELRIKEATAVKERHNKFLFTLPQVVAVGVGLSQTHKEVAILMYVKRALTKKERKAFPKTLEGVPVEVIVSGPFRALPGASPR